MGNRLFQKDIISISDFTRDDIALILETAELLKRSPNADLLKGRLLAVAFLKHRRVQGCHLKRRFNGSVVHLSGLLMGVIRPWLKKGKPC